MRSPEELQQERIDEIQKEKRLRGEIERLTAERDDLFNDRASILKRLERLTAERDHWREECVSADDEIERLQAKVDLTQELHAKILGLIGSEGMTNDKFVRWVKLALAATEQEKDNANSD